jgi:hypothetical protein
MVSILQLAIVHGSARSCSASKGLLIKVLSENLAGTGLPEGYRPKAHNLWMDREHSA